MSDEHSRLPPDRLWQQTTAKWFLVVFGFSVAYAVVRYHLAGDVPWRHFLLFILNKATALAAVIFVASSYLIGKIIRWHDHDRALRMRFVTTFLILISSSALGSELPPPIIDVHLHTKPPEKFLPFSPRPSECALPERLPAVDPRQPTGLPDYMRAKEPYCSQVLPPAQSEEEFIAQTVERLERYNIFAVSTGSAETLATWAERAPGRIIPAGGPANPADPDEEALRRRVERGDLEVFAEISTQYMGIAPDDPVMETFWALAEELSLPVGIHIGPSAAGVPAVAFPTYRARISNPLALEEVLMRHPKLRVYVMHAGWPMESEMIHMLYSYPQLYVDIAVLDWHLPRAEFHRYLERLVGAGFSDRILFGSDQMIWPGAIDVAIESVESASFLSDSQKRDIFYNNAARFLGLSEQEVARHHGN